MSRKLGILGGAFNPPHHGHVRAALDVKEILGLERVLLIPSGRHPFKGERMLAAPRHRLAMTKLACGDDGELDACAIEIERTGTAYTVETLTELSRRYSDCELVFLLGRDLLPELHLWKGWQCLLDIAHLCLMTRPGPMHAAGATPEVEAWLQRHRRSAAPTLSRDEDGRFGFVPLLVTPLEISSSDMRWRISQGRSIRFLTTDAVVAYIDQHGLYRNVVPDPPQGQVHPGGHLFQRSCHAD
ncbi:MAG: nicotinate (nicotinamide) nucleotide adenylyltransferase [Magnetococcales bacterium]|nr:nicotinate (nicotinamide) nucleotide adenylyltransferase [Magnetococcales bacterium]